MIQRKLIQLQTTVILFFKENFNQVSDSSRYRIGSTGAPNCIFKLAKCNLASEMGICTTTKSITPVRYLRNLPLTCEKSKINSAFQKIKAIGLRNNEYFLPFSQNKLPLNWQHKIAFYQKFALMHCISEFIIIIIFALGELACL